MGERHRMKALALAMAAGLAVCAAGAAGIASAGCKGGEQKEPRRRGDVAAATPTQSVDTALDSELAEGTDDAFGLPIPRGMVVRARFPDAVFAAGSMRLEDVASYVRERVTPEHVETGPSKTVLTGARLREGAFGEPGADKQEDPKSNAKVLRIEVIERGGEVSLVVRDETRPPQKEGMTEADRWRELGLTPEGAPLDPTTLE